MKIYKKIIKYLFAHLSIELALIWPLKFNIEVMRKLQAIQLSAEQLKLIAMTVKRKAPCKLLIFGLGNDSVYWSKLNRHGVTIFLEDNKEWFNKVIKKSNDLIAFLINYNTKRKDWKSLLKSSCLLNIVLPINVEKDVWDVIIVDGPAGYYDQDPGRMKSIYLASILVKNQGDIFVHDCNREVEDIYSNIFLKQENLKIEIDAQTGLLRHYHITNRST